MKRVLFVCYGNSCRSQMAEAWARHYGSGLVEALSAGIHPLGHIAEETEQVMAERGISMNGQSSKALDDCDLARMDVLVDMSGCALEREQAGFVGQWLEWKVDDPFGDDLAVYRRVRDEIERRVQQLLEDLRQQKATAEAS